FLNKKSADIAEELYQELSTFYKRKSSRLAESTLPVLKDIYESRGQTIENIVVPFSDGSKQIQITSNLKKAFETKGKELVKDFERSVSLALIDEAWKEHLREMDELKQSVQNAVYEQKDPLLIYKFESFELFKQMISSVNKEVMSFIYRGSIPSQTNAEEVKEARPTPNSDLSKLKVSKPNYTSNSSAGNELGEEAPKAQPVRVEQKIGRNDLCPCGSGKKYKSCHGTNAQ
ncbi:MAG: hypothetical protein RI952_1703, partial [Bacteroidota bacterium]